MDCLFCKIIEGNIPSKKIFENDKVIVIMDIHPNTNGHLLVIPKKHFTNFIELNDEYLLEINKVAKDMTKLLYERLNCDGLKVTVNYGCCQDIDHYHLHLIPKYKKEYPLEDLDILYQKLI